MKKTLLLLAVVLMGLSMMAQTNTYTKVTSASDLSSGDKVLLVGIHEDGSAYAMSYQKSNNRHAVDVTVNGDAITATVASDPSDQTSPYEITVGMASGNFTFYDEVKGGYLYAAGGGNYLKTQTNLDDKGQWTLSMEGDGFVPTSMGAVEQNIMRFNINNSTPTGTPLFGCYKASSSVVGLVYIFKAGGAPVIDPEPSNYPTNFEATIDITRVTLTWTASTGAQLPRGYVVIGTTGSIVKPTDGTPVENDTDPTDGVVAYNTTGTSVYFDQLTPNSTWKFAIFPYTNSGDNIDYKTSGSYPHVNVATQNVTCIFACDFSDGFEPYFNPWNLEGEQAWSASVQYQNAYMNGYANGASNANEDWLVSADIFAAGAQNDVTIAFRNASKFEGNPLEVYMSSNYDGVSDPTDGFTWTSITDNFEWDLNTSAYSWVSTHHTFNTAGKTHLYIAFKYTSTDANSAAWEIDDFMVYTGYNSINENSAVMFNVYPNPATSSINVVADSEGEIQVLDMAGRMVMSVNAVEGENKVNVAELESGVYFVKMNNAVVKFVKR